jgi:branched-chain amino acid transport system substrate-binding protein
VIRRAAAIASIAALALAAAGCADSGDGPGEATLTVYVSVPREGSRAVEGRAVADGARLALSEAGGRVGELRVRAVVLDGTDDGEWSLARTAANARRAAEDTSAIGYLGDVDSGATRVSLPITNQAGIAQISPASTAVDLTRLPPVGADPERYRPSDRQTFARVVPDDEVQAAAAASWARRLGARRASVVADGTVYGRTVADAFSEAAQRVGIAVQRTRTGKQGTEGLPVDLRAERPDVVYLAATPVAAPPLLVSSRSTGAPVIGPDALIDPAFMRGAAASAGRLYLTSPFIDPIQLPSRGQRFARSYRRQVGRAPVPAAAYGYEAMALLLDAIRRAGAEGDERGAVIDELLSTSDRRSVLGTYSIDGNGDTTLDGVSGYLVADGVPAFPVELRPPR